MTTIQYVSWLLACVIIIGMCLFTGIYLINTEHYGWAWIPFVIAAFTGSQTQSERKKEEIKENDKI